MDSQVAPGDRNACVVVPNGVADIEQAPVLEMLKAQDAGVGAAMTRIGVTGGKDADGASPEQRLEVLAKKVAKDKGITIAKASVEVMDTPEGQQLYAEQFEAYRATN